MLITLRLDIRSLVTVGVSCALTVATTAHAASVQAVRTVAVTGDRISGLGPDESLSRLFITTDSHEVDRHGHVAFYGRADDGDVGIWSEGGGSMRLVAREGMLAAGTNGRVFDELAPATYYDISMGPNGDIAFVANTTRSTGVWFDDGQQLTLVGQQGDPIPGIPGESWWPFQAFSLPHINSAGQIAFTNQTPRFSDRSDRGVWAGPPDAIQLVARRGDPVPDVSMTASLMSPVASGINSSGDIALKAWVGGGSGLIVTDSGLEPVLISGEPAPMLEDTFVESVLTIHLADNGHVSALATLDGPTIDASNREAFFSQRNGELHLVARTSQPAPGTPEGVVFSRPIRGNGLTRMAADRDGNITFVGTLSGPNVDATNNRGIWSNAFGEMDLVARLGDHVVGLPEGAVLTSLNSLPSMSDFGQTGFVGGWQEADETMFGVWVQDRWGELQQIVRQGDTIEVAPGEFRTITRLIRSELGPGGHVAFGAQLDDQRSALFVSRLVAVPEPGSALLAAIGFFAATAAGRRRRK